MKKPNVLVTRKMPAAGLAVLKGKVNLTMIEKGRPLTKAELAKAAAGKDAIIPMLTDAIDAAFLKKNKQLKVVSNLAVGFNNVDLAAASKMGIPVTNTPGRLTDSVAEFSVALILSLMRRVGEGERLVRAGKYKGWAPDMLVGESLFDKKVGLVGFGRIGQKLAEILKGGFGSEIFYHDEFRQTEENEAKFGVTYKPLAALLKECDVISLHVPLMRSTTHLVGAKELKMMKKTAYLVNTSRGPVVDEKALVSALKKKTIAGAALDVYEFEPKLAAGLAKLDNAVLTPHAASAVSYARDEMAVMAALSVLDALDGRPLARLVNKDILSK